MHTPVEPVEGEPLERMLDRIKGGGITPLVDDQTALIDIESIRSDQFDAVPGVATPGQITRLEEDKIMAYYGGGTLYATPERAEPWL